MSRGREDGGGFLSRWSRLKQEAREAEEKPKAETAEPEPQPEPEPEQAPDADPARAPLPETPENAPPAVAEDAPAEEEPPLDLPDIETLTRDSDYTWFLRAEVPAELRKQALRKLWRSDPVFANLDGLNDYDQNYAAPSIVGAAVRTAYDVIKGYAPRDIQVGDATAEAAGERDSAPQQIAAALQDKDAAPEQLPDETAADGSDASAVHENNEDGNGPLSREDQERS